MSDTRRRVSVSPRQGKSKGTPPSSVPTSRSVASAQQATSRRTTGFVTLGLSVLFGSALFLVFNNNLSSTLPRSYALCSRERNIYTVDEVNPRVECCVVHNGRIADTGSISEIASRWGDKERTGPVKAAPEASAKEGLKFYFVKRGSIVIPGFADAHGHVLEYGFKRQLDLEGSGSVQDVIQHVRSFIQAHPDIQNDTSRWVEGFGWNQILWSSSGKFPTADELDEDAVLRGRPIALTRIDGHAAWVSPAVLKLMHPLPKSVEGGDIIRDETGLPTGIFVDNAMTLIPRPQWTHEVMKRYFATTMRDAVAHGLTSIHDAGSSPEQIQFFKTMADEHMLPIRLYVMGHVDDNNYWGHKIQRLEDYGGRLTVRSVKLISDGALGSWGAAMLEPYTDNPSTSGLLLTPPEILSSLIYDFFRDDWQVNVHCIGDHANKLVLNIFERALQGRNVSVVRPRIEHAQIMQLADLNRTGTLGVIASVQPTHATSDMSYAETRVGPERIKGAYAYQTLLKNSPNSVMPIGSDFPIESIDPIKGFYAAVSRVSPEGISPHGPGGWFPSERLTRAQALKGMTFDPAYAAFREDEFGSIVIGHRADLTVLDSDIMTVPIDQVLNTRVTGTIIDGELVYGKIV
ncbi:hypothetical protein K439DRAFT_1661297 [Ramaria rubella]|nr:hypothetical protein K439DRAFT_1661297 [Ramaria rubella]